MLYLPCSVGMDSDRSVKEWRYPSKQWVKPAERLVKLDMRLPAILDGDEKPDSPKEQVDFAVFCVSHRPFYRAAARFFSDAFAADPKLANDLKNGTRYIAACAASLAAAGRGKDAANLDDSEKARLRKQADQWLRADLSAYVMVINPKWAMDTEPEHRPYFALDKREHKALFDKLYGAILGMTQADSLNLLQMCEKRGIPWPE